MGGVVRQAIGRHRRDRGRQGFTLIEVAVVLLVIVILVGIVIMLVLGLFGHARETGLETDLRTVKSAVDAYILESQDNRMPTEDGGLPLLGEYALIDFDAPFVRNGQTLTFYPHILAELPRHWDEGVWRIDSGAHVSIDMPEEEY
jgi:prepilin-type N-terminal cleavage/methylation domain-containing protein